MNRNLVLLLASISLVILIGFFYDNINKRKINPIENTNETNLTRKWKKVEIKIGNKNYEILVTENDLDRKNGLSIFDEIKDNEGMLFEFPEDNYHTFWMKNMKFDIDMIFLDKEKKVIQIHENVQKNSYKDGAEYKLYSSKLKSKYVIEIRSGEIKKNLLKAGDVLEFK